jgi:ATP-dependent DNA helicase RecQ
LGRALSTMLQYLVEFLRRERRLSPAPWVDDETFQRIAAFAATVPDDRLTPMYEHFGGEISYEQLRIAMACVRNRRDIEAQG